MREIIDLLTPKSVIILPNVSLYKPLNLVTCWYANHTMLTTTLFVTSDDFLELLNDVSRILVSFNHPRSLFDFCVFMLFAVIYHRCYLSSIIYCWSFYLFSKSFIYIKKIKLSKLLWKWLKSVLLSNGNKVGLHSKCWLFKFS